MSDSTAPISFAEVFDSLQDFFDGKINQKKLFSRVYEASAEHDFHPGELECDEILIKNGLAKRDKKDKDEVLYKGVDY